MGVAVVLGASGFIGTRLVRWLSDRGVAVRAFDLEAPRARVDGVDYERLDVREPLPVWAADGADVIYNLAAVHRSPGHKSHEYYATNVLGALNVITLAQDCGVSTVVFLSSIAVYGPSDDRITEVSPMAPASDYGRSKQIAEAIHRNWVRQSNERRLVTVRPGVVFGPGERGNFTRLAHALRRGAFAYPGRKTTVKSGGHVDELLGAIDFALQRYDQEIVFNFAYPEESTTEDIVRAFADVAGFSSRYAVVPVPIMLAAARLCEAVTSLGFPNPMHRDRVMKLVQSTRIGPEWLQQNGFDFGGGLAAALERWRDETGGRFQ